MGWAPPRAVAAASGSGRTRCLTTLAPLARRLRRAAPMPAAHWALLPALLAYDSQRRATAAPRTPRHPQTPDHPRPARPCLSSTARRHASRCRRGESCRTASRSGNRLLPSLSRVTPSVVSEHSSELIGCPISRSLTTSCVCLELRPFPPSALPDFNGTASLSVTPGRPARPSRASGWSSLTTPRGFPCRVRFPCVHAVATTPAQRPGLLLRSFTQPCQPSPIWLSGRPAHRPFRGLLGVHSRYGLHTRAVTNS
jgi:hypothetical protein